jgi:pilus assembly protein CpaE
MDNLAPLVGFHPAPSDTAPRFVPSNGERAPTAIAYVKDPESAAVAQRCFTDLGFVDGTVAKGGIADAIAQLSQRSWPRFLIVDVNGIADPLPQINRLAEVCNPETEVIVVGERNDIVLYRDLKAAGVAEYFYKPLLSSLLGRTITEIDSGVINLLPSRSGKLIVFLGVRGGVGATTIVTSLAWYFAEVRQRGVLLLDLDLQAGDSALQLGAQPSHALREALDDPRRIDELFLERGVVSVTDHLGLLAGLEPMSDRLVLNEEAVVALLQKLLTHYRYVLVDLPGDMVRSLPRLMRMPSALVLVSDATLTSVREVGRWRDFLGPNTAERMLLHVLNKKNALGALPEEEMLRVIPSPDISLRWHRDIMSAASLGTKAVQQCSAMRDAVAALSVRLLGAASEEERSLWQRIFG